MSARADGEVYARADGCVLQRVVEYSIKINNLHHNRPRVRTYSMESVMNSPIHNLHPACLARRRKSREEKHEARLKMVERAEMKRKDRPLERTVLDGGCVLYRPSGWAAR